MSQSQIKKAIIIGGGIAGTTVAMFLQKIGIEPLIFESQSAQDVSAAKGAYLNIGSNGLSVLHELGLEQVIRSQAHACQHILLRSGRTGATLYDYVSGTEDFQSITIRRFTLCKILMDEVQRRGISVEFSKKLSSAAELSDGQVVARFTDGTDVSGDILIGCDGINSKTRQIFFPDAPKPQYTGQVGFGGFVQPIAGLEPTPDHMHMIFGKRGFFSYMVQETGEIWWFSNMPYEPTTQDRTTFALRSEVESVPAKTWIEKLRVQHELDEPNATIMSILDHVDEKRWDVYPTFDILPSVASWTKGKVVLVGDAAHATSPHAGQGASMAFEDAIVLAKCLRDIPNAQEACVMFQNLRKPRVDELISEARKRGDQKTEQSTFMLWLRDWILPLMMRLFANGERDKIFGYRVRWEDKIQEQ